MSLQEYDKRMKKLLKVFQPKTFWGKAIQLTTLEIIEMYAHLGYILGANLAGYVREEDAPSVEELRKRFQEEKTNIGIALMIQTYYLYDWIRHLKQGEKDEAAN